jgi:hypothetical protein
MRYVSGRLIDFPYPLSESRLQDEHLLDKLMSAISLIMNAAEPSRCGLIIREQCGARSNFSVIWVH